MFLWRNNFHMFWCPFKVSRNNVVRQSALVFFFHVLASEKLNKLSRGLFFVSRLLLFACLWCKPNTCRSEESAGKISIAFHALVFPMNSLTILNSCLQRPRTYSMEPIVVLSLLFQRTRSKVSKTRLLRPQSTVSGDSCFGDLGGLELTC